MKTIKIIAIAIGASSLVALPVMSGPVVTVQVPAPVVTVQVPAPPAVTVDIGVPDTYVWDGVEYVGVVGGQYYYLGPGDIWLPFDAVRVARFHDWERVHADWRDHAIHNDLYRHDAHGHEVPMRDNHAATPSHDTSPANSHGNSPDNGHDKDHDHDH
jgi:hypothetical protein